jgi:hypothetical protein
MTDDARFPLTPIDCDLRDFPRMMVDVGRMMGSEFNSTASRTPVAWMVGHKLWYRAWHQVPAASLPDDDDQLCHLAELGFDQKTWKKVKAIALRNWVKCADGRLYHPVLAEVALDSWIRKLLQRAASGAGNAKRHGYAYDAAAINFAIEEASGLLAALNPHAPMVDKLKRRLPKPSPDDLPPGAEKPPTGSPDGADNAPTGTPTRTPTGAPDDLPVVSQETGTETETERVLSSETKVSSDGGAKRARPKRPLPEDWTPSEIDRAYAAKQGFGSGHVDRMAERFANHARQQDRACADWQAAWRNWVLKELELKPAKPKVQVW